jgi:hypothetical protein
MDELHSPRRPDLADIRVLASESELQRLSNQYPGLTRDQLLDAIKQAGPLRRDIEAELERLSRQSPG